MTALSPAARAIYVAFLEQFDWILDPEQGAPGPQFNAIAAALRAAADQAVPSETNRPLNYLPVLQERERIRGKLLAIANELDGAVKPGIDS